MQMACSTCYSVTIMPSHPTPTPNFPLFPVRDGSQHLLLCNHHAFPSDANTQFPAIQCKWPQHLLLCNHHALHIRCHQPISSQFPAGARRTRYSVTIMPSHPTPTPNFSHFPAGARRICYSLPIMTSHPTPTRQFRAISCGSSKYLLFSNRSCLSIRCQHPISRYPMQMPAAPSIMKLSCNSNRQIPPNETPIPPPSTLSRKKMIRDIWTTFRDIWGHMSHFHTKIAIGLRSHL